MTQETDFHVMVAVGQKEQLVPLLRLACMLTEVQGGRATLICVTPDGQRPPWLTLPDDCGRLQVAVDVRKGDDPGPIIVSAARRKKADLLLLGWTWPSGKPNKRCEVAPRNPEPGLFVGASSSIAASIPKP